MPKRRERVCRKGTVPLAEKRPRKRRVAVAGDHVERQDVRALVERVTRGGEHLAQKVVAGAGEDKRRILQKLNVAAQQRLGSLFRIGQDLLELVDGNDDPPVLRGNVVEHALERGFRVPGVNRKGDRDTACAVLCQRGANGLEEPSHCSERLFGGRIQRADDGVRERLGELPEVGGRVHIGVNGCPVFW